MRSTLGMIFGGIALLAVAAPLVADEGNKDGAKKDEKPKVHCVCEVVREQMAPADPALDGKQIVVEGAQNGGSGKHLALMCPDDPLRVIDCTAKEPIFGANDPLKVSFWRVKGTFKLSAAGERKIGEVAATSAEQLAPKGGKLPCGCSEVTVLSDKSFSAKRLRQKV